MGRGGRGRGGGYGGGGDKTEALFNAIMIEKVDTVRYSFVHGGVPLSASNDLGQTPLMVAASNGKEKSLDVILDQVRRIRGKQERSEILDAQDEDGQTPLMMAAVRNKFWVCKQLKEAGAWLGCKDLEGLTARGRADFAGNQKIVELLDGTRTHESDSEPDSAEDSDGGFEGETSTQRSKRKKKEKEGGNVLTSVAKKERAKKESEAAKEAAPAAEAAEPVDSSEPVLPEISEALAAAAQEEKTSGALKDLTLSLIRTQEEQASGLKPGAMDPALWRCGLSIRHLVIRWRPGLAAGSLDKISALKRVLHLIIQDSALAALPSSLGELQELRSLEVDGNNLTEFPSSIESLSKTLDTISAARNKLTSAALPRLAPLTHLVSLKLDNNKITDIEDLQLADKPHLVTLSLANNKLTELPEDPWEKLAMLQHLNVSSNKITELPCEIGAMKEKKFTEMLLDENPWKDGKIRSMIENSAVLSQTVLVYLRKQKPKAGKKAKAKAKRKPKAESESEPESDNTPAPAKAESSEDEAPAPPPPPAAKKKGKKGKKASAAAEPDSDG